MSEHDFDDDAVCRCCGFDGAEWWHLERMKPKEERSKSPACNHQWLRPDNGVIECASCGASRFDFGT